MHSKGASALGTVDGIHIVAGCTGESGADSKQSEQNQQTRHDVGFGPDEEKMDGESKC
jgi:hypothetical protein